MCMCSYTHTQTSSFNCVFAYTHISVPVCADQCVGIIGLPISVSHHHESNVGLQL